MNIVKNTYDYFDNLFHPQDFNLADQGRRRLFVASILAIILSLVIFGIMHFKKGDYQFGIVNYFLITVFSGFIICLRYSKTGKTVYRLSLALLIILLGYWLKSGTGEGYSSIWVLSFPPFAFFLMGKKEGCIWSILLAIITIAFFINPFSALTSFPYSRIFILRHLFTLFLIFCFTYIYESVRKQFQDAMETEQQKLLLEKELLEKAKNDVDEINVKLNDEMIIRQRAEDELKKHHAHLEELVATRTLELQKNNKELEASEKRYRILADNVNDLFWATDLKLNFTYISPSVSRIYGYTVEEAMNLKLNQWYTTESHQAILQAYQEQKELVGHVPPVKTDPESFFFIELEQLKKDGTLVNVELKSSLARDNNGQPIGFVGVTRDISERIKNQREKEKIQEQLAHAQKMEAVGQLAGGVAHDLNNVLGILSGYSELLLMEISGNHKAKKHVEKILQSTEKGAAIIEDLLTLARRGVTVSEVVNLNNIIVNFLETPVFEMMKNAHPRITFKTEYQTDLLNIKGSPVHLEKTIMNLMLNAADAITDAGEVTIRTENRYVDGSIRKHHEVIEGDYVILTVSDTGMGIPVEHRKKIFEPFYTRKTMNKSGTGLGLAIVWGTVKDHKGYIDLQTEVGEGTTFTLYFPATREEVITPRRKEPMEQYMGHGESVLVVDDVAEQRDIASGLLKKLGYQVITVAGGEEALEHLKNNQVDILVLDMIMTPGIDGLDTYKRALEINPKQKAILVSGFSETDRVKKAKKLGAGAYVRKPYVMEKIGLAIRDELKR
jgi:PAS domain S-box-containing protein